MTTQSDWRDEPMTLELRKNSTLLIVGMIGVIIGIAIGFIILGRTDNGLSYFTNVYTEIIGVAVTVVVIERFFEMRRTNELKEQLLWEAGSKSNDIAINAVDTLRRKGWLKGKEGLLQSVDLTDANLCGAYLQGANLRSANLWSANLQKASVENADLRGSGLQFARLQETNFTRAHMQGTDLNHANLQQASLIDADLRYADLHAANLQKAVMLKAKLCQTDLRRAVLRDATLWEVDFRDAVFSYAELQGADLNNADLRGADMRTATFDEHTTLPDGTKWKPDTILRRFTHPEEFDA